MKISNFIWILDQTHNLQLINQSKTNKKAQYHSNKMYKDSYNIIQIKH